MRCGDHHQPLAPRALRLLRGCALGGPGRRLRRGHARARQRRGQRHVDGAGHRRVGPRPHHLPQVLQADRRVGGRRPRRHPRWTRRRGVRQAVPGPSFARHLRLAAVPGDVQEETSVRGEHGRQDLSPPSH